MWEGVCSHCTFRPTRSSRCRISQVHVLCWHRNGLPYMCFPFLGPAQQIIYHICGVRTELCLARGWVGG